MAIDRSELRRGLTETRRYLLSHHVPAEYHRCYAPTLFGRRVHVCARCSGIYPGIVLGILATFLAPAILTGLALIAVLPLPALVEWTITSMTDRRGFNAARTATGGALGYAYGLGLVRIVFQGDIGVIVIGAVYGMGACILLYYRARHEYR